MITVLLATGTIVIGLIVWQVVRVRLRGRAIRREMLADYQLQQARLAAMLIERVTSRYGARPIGRTAAGVTLLAGTDGRVVECQCDNCLYVRAQNPVS